MNRIVGLLLRDVVRLRAEVVVRLRAVVALRVREVVARLREAAVDVRERGDLVFLRAVVVLRARDDVPREVRVFDFEVGRVREFVVNCLLQNFLQNASKSACVEAQSLSFSGVVKPQQSAHWTKLCHMSNRHSFLLVALKVPFISVGQYSQLPLNFWRHMTPALKSELQTKSVDLLLRLAMLATAVMNGIPRLIADLNEVVKGLE